MPDVRLMTYAPGHFHAALVQKEMIPGVLPCVHVYAPLDSDLLAHLGRIANFNSRPESPTCWAMEVHTSSNPLGRMLAEKPGNVVVLSGRNRGKIDVILAALQAELHVLADKPWIIRSADLPRLREALDLAERRQLVALDIMTERWEVTTRLQRELIHDPALFGSLESGSIDRPTVFMESVHYINKSVAGTPLRRPAWWFDIHETGEGLADVGTHLVDLVPWLLFPNQSIAVTDLELLRARRQPTMLSRADFQKVTGESEFPRFLADSVQSGQLLYYCNTTLSYLLRGIHVWLNIAWDFEAGPNQGDLHLARIRGSRSIIEVRQGAAEHFIPEVYVVPRDEAELPTIRRVLAERLDALQADYPGLDFEQVGPRLRLSIPDRLRVGHEAHFAEVTRLFLDYIEQPSRLPRWEKDNMWAKYYVTTHGVDLSRR